LVKCNYISYNSGLTDTLELLSLPQPPDAIIATHGLLVTSAMRAIESRGLRIPDDIQIVGYMSDWVSEVTSPRVSFVKQNQKEIGTKAFKLLFDQLNGDTCVQHVIVKARLETKESTK
jgi:LacI family transcriptional regulator